MAVTAYKLPGSASGTNWTNPTNVFASDDSRAIYGNSAQNDLFVTNFDFSDIPAGSTILGVEVEVEGHGPNATAANRSIAVGMTKNGSSLSGSRLASQNLPQNTDAVRTYGSATNLFSTTLTLAEVQTSTWGVMLRTNNTNTAERRIDRVSVRIHYAIPMDTFEDDFNDGVLNTDFGEWSPGDLVETGGTLRITSTTGASYKGMETLSKYNLVGSSLIIELVHALTGLTDDGTFIQLILDASNTLTFFIYNDTLTAEKQVATSFTTLATVAYNGTTHRWLRIRESSGTIYYDYSSDGINWTNFTSTTAFTVSALSLSLFIGTDASNGGTDTAQFDNLNLPPSAGMSNKHYLGFF